MVGSLLARGGGQSAGGLGGNLDGSKPQPPPALCRILSNTNLMENCFSKPPIELTRSNVGTALK